MTPLESNAGRAKYAVGQWLYFTPNTAARAPFGTIIPEGAVLVTEVVDHGSANIWGASRFSYVVRALGGTGTQGTDDSELSELPEPMRVNAPEGEAYSTLIYATREVAAASAVEYIAKGVQVDMPDVWTVRVYDVEAGPIYGVEPGGPRAPFAKAVYEINEPGARNIATSRRMEIDNGPVTANTYPHPETGVHSVAVFVGTRLAYQGAMPGGVAQGSPEFYEWVRTTATAWAADSSRCSGCGLGFAGPRGVRAHRAKAGNTAACRDVPAATVQRADISATVEPMVMTTHERAKAANAALTTEQRSAAGRARAAQLHSPVSLARRLGVKWAELDDAERKAVRRELRAAGVIA